ncbi:hypothetical protein [Actinophytocola sp.]|uniref:hypothetical protein n=1 Tax=Actinophytocola sp. TaxID=1872138 RepID=UPI003D6B765F
MDPRERADTALAKARARGAFVVTPESAVSPMDAASTLQIPRVMVSSNDERGDDPDSTLVVPRSGGPAENIPAIAQEAMTDVVSSPPGIRSRQRRIEHARAQSIAARQQKMDTRPKPDAHQSNADQPTQPTQVAPDTRQPTPDAHRESDIRQPEARQQEPESTSAPAQKTEELDGLIPTTKEPPTGTGSLSQRLDG